MCESGLDPVHTHTHTHGARTKPGSEAGLFNNKRGLEPGAGLRCDDEEQV